MVGTFGLRARALVHGIEDTGAGIVQMPCPEQRAWAWGAIGKQGAQRLSSDALAWFGNIFGAQLPTDTVALRGRLVGRLWGINNISGGIIGVPLSFLVIYVVSQFTTKPSEAMQAIEKVVEEATRVPEPVAAVEVEAPVAPEGVAVPADAEVPAVSEAAAETAPAEVQAEGAGTEEAGGEATFEELFKLRPETFRPPTSAEEEDKGDKKGKKGKKSVEYQFDEDRGEVVGRKKHKRGDTWEEE